MPDSPRHAGLDLRASALELSAENVDAPVSTAGVFGAVMDWGLSKGLVTLVAIADGSTSIYAGGGGFIGGHAVPAVREAAGRFLQVADRFVSEFPLTIEHPTPRPGHAIFHILTTAGVRTSPEIDTATLGPGKPGASELFGAAQLVITQLRMAKPNR
jgi:hypothetical protein